MKRAAPVLTCVITLLLTHAYSSYAQSRQDWRTIRFLHEFTRHTTRHVHTGRHKYSCVHTADLAHDHRALWHYWVKKRRWPNLVDRWGKPKATSLVRVSYYGYNDSAGDIEVDITGRRSHYVRRYDMGPYEHGVLYLTPRQMRKLQQRLQSLPRSRRVVTWKDALFISGRRNGRWFVRMYSRRHKPRAARRLLHTLMPDRKMIYKWP